MKSKNTQYCIYFVLTVLLIVSNLQRWCSLIFTFFNKSNGSNAEVWEITLLCIEMDSWLWALDRGRCLLISTFPVLHTNLIWFCPFVVVFVIFLLLKHGLLKKTWSMHITYFYVGSGFEILIKKCCMNCWGVSHWFDEATCSDFTNLTNPPPFCGLW